MKNLAAQLLLRSRYPFALTAGLLLAASFPKIGLAGLAWAAPAFMLAAAHGKVGAEAFRIGYVAGLAHNLASLYWLLLIPVTGYPILGWLALSAYVALYPATWVWLLSGKVGTGSWTQRAAWSLAGAAVWVALEMIVSRFLGGFPWNLLGNSQYQMLPLIQIAALTGVYGVSFLMVWASLCLFSAIRQLLSQPTRRFVWQTEIVLPLAVVVVVFAFGMSRLREPTMEGPALRVTFVQPSIPQTMIWDTSANSNRFEQLLQLTQRALTNETDLLLWPEAALPEFNETSFTAITNLIQSHRLWMIFGADDAERKSSPTATEKYDFYNAAFLFNPEGRYAASYRKQKLVIFGEYIPLVRWLPFVKWFTPITSGFTPGERVVPFMLDRWSQAPDDPPVHGDSSSRGGAPHRSVKTATLICFEDVFPHHVPQYVNEDTDFLVNLTNDGWFGEGAEQWQHAAAGVFRAVENGVPLLRSCNNGLTCWIDACGRLRQIFRDPAGSEYGVGVMSARIPLAANGEGRSRTFYNGHGDWFGWSCVAVTAVVLLPNLRKITRRKQVE